MELSEKLTIEVLKAHECYKSVDYVASDPLTTDFKRRARLQQALWREKMELPIGTQPTRPKKGTEPSPLGSRIELERAYKTGANFLSDDIREVVIDRISHPQPYQTLNVDRLYCDLLSSMPMCFNLFGSLKYDIESANQAVHTWWPDVPGLVSDVMFEWSPGRRIPGLYLENRSAFDVAFKLDLPDGSQGILGIETKYHEHCKKEKDPIEYRKRRYEEVTIRSGVMSKESLKAVIGADLQQIWLDHLLALSMLQDPKRKWGWAGFVLVHPEKNPSYANACQRYNDLLLDSSSFRVNTIESLLAARVINLDVSMKFTERYLW